MLYSQNVIMDCKNTACLTEQVKRFNKRIVYFVVFGFLQIVVIGILFKYFLWYSTAHTFNTIYRSLENVHSNNSSAGKIFQENLGITEQMTSLYFVPERSKSLYVWENEGFAPVKISEAFSKERTMELVTRPDCMKNKTEANAFKADQESNICTAIRQEFDDVNKFVIQEELDMPIAFSILVYTDYDMLELLLRTIHRPHNTYCIHVDVKSSRTFKDRVLKLAECFRNVFVANKLYSVHWGTFSVLGAEMSCMEDLLKKTRSWKYFINLTGQEFPLRTNYEITKILQALRGFNNVRCKKDFEKSRIKTSGPPPYGLTVYKSSTHVVLTRQFVEYMLTDEKAQNVINWSKTLKVPDEMVLPILNCNRKLKAPGSYDAYPSVYDQRKSYVARYKSWKNYSSSCHGKIVRGVCVFGPRDLQTLQTRHELFANKFHIHEDPELPYCLRSIILKRTVLENSGYIDFNVSYYENIPYKH